jgi:shikimate dehydrogenase
MKHNIEIDGATRLFVIIGDPIVQAKSPSVYSQLFADRGIPAVMLPLHIHPPGMELLGPLLELIQNLDGILVTAPYKNSLLALCSSLGPAAQCVGAVNALRRAPGGGWHGDLFDGAGFVAGARQRGIELPGRRVLQFGAGGAGSAIAYELASAGVQSLRLVDPNPEKVKRLCAAIQGRFPKFDISPALLGATFATEDINMVINSSTVGMGGAKGIPGTIPPLTADTVVGEVNVTDHGTDLVRLAIEAGATWTDGAHMHAGQINEILAFFFNPITDAR